MIRIKIIPRTVSSKIKDVMEGARIKQKQKDDKKDAEFYDTSKVDYHNIGKEIKKLEKLMKVQLQI